MSTKFHGEVRTSMLSDDGTIMPKSRSSQVLCQWRFSCCLGEAVLLDFAIDLSPRRMGAGAGAGAGAVLLSALDETRAVTSIYSRLLKEYKFRITGVLIEQQRIRSSAFTCPGDSRMQGTILLSRLDF